MWISQWSCKDVSGKKKSGIILNFPVKFIVRVFAMEKYFWRFLHVKFLICINFKYQNYILFNWPGRLLTLIVKEGELSDNSNKWIGFLLFSVDDFIE